MFRKIRARRAAKSSHAIRVTEPDFERVSNLNRHDVLARELSRALVVPAQSVPPDLVTMNSSVLFEDETTGGCSDITIVYPHDADSSRGNISVLTPIGTALLGLSEGQSIVWPFPDGSMRTLRVVRLLYQPEAAEQELLPHDVL